MTSKQLIQELRCLREKLAALECKITETKPVGLAAYDTENRYYVAKSADLLSAGVGWFCENS